MLARDGSGSIRPVVCAIRFRLVRSVCVTRTVLALYHRNAVMPADTIVADGQACELWRGPQNRYFREHGLDLTVDPAAAYATPRIGPIPGRSARRMKQQNGNRRMYWGP